MDERARTMRRVMHHCFAGVGLALLAAACNRHSPSSMWLPNPPGASAASSTASALASAGPALHGVPCGALDCTQYDAPRDAFRDVIASGPLVLGVGEAHAPKGASAPSAARRFADELLPQLAGHASDLLVELMMPPSGCSKAAAEVRKDQQPVTSRQASTDQSEYVTMGERARGLGIVPDMLRPTCADLDAVHDAGDGAIGASLSMIARLSASQAERLVDRDARSAADRDKMVVVYGGMLHNDLSPPPERAAWSYALGVDAHVQGRFVALDLVVPEFVGDDDTWRALPWWPHYDRARLGGKTTLFRLGERSFVLVFPETGR
jgi:hypothetical protein